MGRASQGKARFLMDDQSASQLQLHRTAPHAPSFARGRMFTSLKAQHLECFSLEGRNQSFVQRQTVEHSFD